MDNIPTQFKNSKHRMENTHNELDRFKPWLMNDDNSLASIRRAQLVLHLPSVRLQEHVSQLQLIGFQAGGVHGLDEDLESESDDLL